MHILIVTTEYPCEELPNSGIFVARQVEMLRGMGCDVDVLAFQSRANPLNHFRAWRRLLRMKSLKKYDVLHAHFGPATLVARAQFELPVVVTYHGEELQGIVGDNGKYGLKGYLLIALSQLLGLWVDHLIVVSRRMGGILLRKDFSIIPSGVDLEKFKPMPRDEARARLGWHRGKRVVLFAAADVSKPIKRYDLARAAVELASREIDLELRVATGVPPDQIPLYLNASDALLLTSVQEGSPTIVKESLACNLPVVTVDVGDVRERLADVSPSAICEATAESLADGLVNVLRYPARCRGRDSVRQLDDHNLAIRVIAIYHQMLESTLSHGVP